MQESAFVPARKFYDIIERLDLERDPSGGRYVAKALAWWRAKGAHLQLLSTLAHSTKFFPAVGYMGIKH